MPPPTSVIRTIGTCVLLLITNGVTAQSPTRVADELAEIREVVRFAPRKSATRLIGLLEQTAAPSLSQRGEILVELSNALLFAGDTSGAMRAGKEAESFGQRSGNNSIIAEGLLAQAYALSANYDELSSQRLIQQAKELAYQTDDIDLQVKATISLGQSVMDAGRHSQGLALINTALKLAQASGNKSSKFIALRARTMQLASVANYKQALRDSDDLISIAKKNANTAHEARARLTEFTIASQAGNSERALAALTSAIPLLKICCGDEALIGPVANLSDLYLQRKKYSKSLEISRQAFQLAKEYGTRKDQETAVFNYGISEIYLGKVKRGKQKVEKVLKNIDGSLAPSSLLEYATALAHAGDTDAALKNYNRAIDLSIFAFNEGKRKSYEALQRAYQYEQKQHETVKLQNDNLRQTIKLREQQQQQWRWTVLATSSLFVLFMLSFFFLRSRGKNKELAIQKNELIVINEKLEWQSDHDALTGIFNRRFFEKYILSNKNHELSVSNGTVKPPLAGSLFLIDVDHFKSVNDTFGHSAGDVVLVEVSNRLKSVLRSQDVLVRWGGEEFLVYLPAVSNSESAELAERMLEAISRDLIFAGSDEIRVTISVGYCPAPILLDGAGMGWEVSIKLADAALYFAKQSGRNRAYGIDNPINASPSALAELQANFGAAISVNSISSREIKGRRVKT